MDKEESFIIIGNSNCPFCVMAVDLCLANHNPFIFLDYESAPNILVDYKNFYGQSTIPIILSNNLKTGRTSRVGGYTELLDLTGHV